MTGIVDRETETLAKSFWLASRQLPRMAPLIALLAALSWGTLWLVTGASEISVPLAFAENGPPVGKLAMMLLAPVVLGAGLLASFIVTAISLRQLSRSEHLHGLRALKALEAEFLPMLRVALYTLRRRLPLALGMAALYLEFGVTPIGGFAFLFDLARDDGTMRLAAAALALLSLAILHDLIPFVFTAYHVLFHGHPPAQAEHAVRQALRGHRERIFGALLLASLPFYLADECLFYIDWHPVLRRMLGAVFALPLLTCAYLQYERLEAAIKHRHD